MIVVSSFEITESGRRSQPWGATEGHQYKAGKYYNFREHPELITTHLEDFVEHADQISVQNFYDFIRWINGREVPRKAPTVCSLENLRMIHQQPYSGVHME